jgi:hypothetical protein
VKDAAASSAVVPGVVGGMAFVLIVVVLVLVVWRKRNGSDSSAKPAGPQSGRGSGGGAGVGGEGGGAGDGGGGGVLAKETPFVTGLQVPESSSWRPSQGHSEPAPEPLYEDADMALPPPRVVEEESAQPSPAIQFKPRLNLNNTKMEVM